MAGPNRRNFSMDVSKELQEAFKTLGGDERREVQIRAIRKAGAVIRKSAKSKARKYSGPLSKGLYKYPRNRGKRFRPRKPGKLQRSITFRVIEFKRKEKTVGLFAVKDPLGHLIEYGHRTRSGRISSGIREGTYKASGGGAAAAFPYARPAISENEDAVMQVLSEELSKFIKNL